MKDNDYDDYEQNPKFVKKHCHKDGVWNEPMFPPEFWSEHDKRVARKERDENTK